MSASRGRPPGPGAGLRLRAWGWTLAILLVLSGITSLGQTDPGAAASGRITGMVSDSWENAPLSGVVVVVRGTTLAVKSGPDGRFHIQHVPAGEHTVVFSRSGFARATVTQVRVGADQTSTVDLALRPEFYEMEEYEVTAENLDTQTEQIFLERQDAATFLDAIGSDQFSNLAVSDAAQVLSKVTGATVADGKYAVVRGLADRYTFTTMNGMELPSADPDRKAFQLDLLPAKFIDRVDVRKTFTPDMGGGFAGGSIDIRTRAYPEQFTFEFRAGTAYNTQSSLRNDFLVSDRSSTDWLGFDDGLRQLPGAAAATPPFGTGAPLDPAIKSTFNSTQFAPRQEESPLDSNFSLVVGDTQEVFGKRLGYFAGLEYKQDYRMYDDGVVRSYDQRGANASIDKTDARGVISYNWAALANLSLELNEQHELRMNVMYVQAAEDEARRLQGQDDVLSTQPGISYVDQSILRWTERNLAYAQLAGAHDLPDVRELRFDWGASFATTSQEEPDTRIFQFFAQPDVPDYDPNGPTSPSRPSRFWRELNEENVNVRGDFSLPIPSYNTDTNLFKVGGAFSQSQRDFSQRGFDVRPVGGRQHPFFTTGDPNLYLDPTNHQYIAYYNFPANIIYNGEQSVLAGYGMAEWAATEWLHLIGGARYETTLLTIDAFDLTRNTALTPGRIDQGDWLPSLSAKVPVRDNLEVRAAWSRTVVRPTYREIAEVPIYDVARNRTYIGNPTLQLSASENLDLRTSWYLRPGELVSFSLFAKRIDRPIEQASVRLDNSLISYANFDQAKVYGLEVETRLVLDRLWHPLAPFTLGLNGAYIKSEVPLTPNQQANRQRFGDFSTTRPLYDQPVYILNADLTWNLAATGTSMTLSGGTVGKRLVVVGLAQPDEFLAPTPELNFVARQKLGKHWDIRFTARNLLNPSYRTIQTWTEVGEVVLRSYKQGMTFGLSLGCEF